ncbi:MAG: sugar dehydrogenase [Solirubrobacterales bacterium]|nr:sugar dehydrogenase [Solirubrobacterales bacterium]
MRSRARTLGIAFLIACSGLAGQASMASAVAPVLPTGFQDTELHFGGFISGHGLEEPTAIRFAGNGQVFIAQKAGEILLYENLSDTTPTVFADLRRQVYDNGDRGLLGLALAPNYPAEPYVYALYTYDHILGEAAPAPKWGGQYAGDPCPEPKGADDCLVSGRLVRLTAEGNHATTKLEEFEEEGQVFKKQLPIVKPLEEGWCQQFSSHSIGDLQFGPEGDLYVSGGEGANFDSPDFGQFGEPPNPCGDPPKEGGSLRSQDVRTLADPTGLSGAILRVNPETGEGAAGNPMAASPDLNARKIIGYGFRNPFRFLIDPATDELYVDNVGADTYEEIDRFDATPTQAYNSGWPCYEGPEPNANFLALELPLCESLYAEPGAVSQPLFYYNHFAEVTPEDGCPEGKGSAISGNVLYEGSALPRQYEFPAKYKGALFFADSVRGCIYVMLPGEDGRPDPSTVAPFLTGGGLYPGVDIQEGPDGALYYASLYGDEYSSGAIHRIAYDPNAPTAKLTVDSPWAESPSGIFHFDASGSTGPHGEALTYAWDLNDDGIFDEELGESEVTKSFGDSFNHVVKVQVENSAGKKNVAGLTVYPGDTPPEPKIIKPTSSLKWSVGQNIEIEGSANDKQDGTLFPPRFDWSTRLYHCPAAGCHAHPLQTFPGVANASFLAPEHDYPSFIEVKFTATDSRGLSASQTVKMEPEAVELTIGSNPPGIPLTIGVSTETSPFEFTAIKGAHITLSAPQTATVGGTTYSWTGWSDGGARTHTIAVVEPTTYKADYAPPPSQQPGGGSPHESPREIPPPVGHAVLHRHPAKQTKSPAAEFTFSDSAGGTSFLCKLDKGSFKRCSSPLRYRNLKPGKHVFKVVTASAGGEANSAPVAYSWNVLRRKR